MTAPLPKIGPCGVCPLCVRTFPGSAEVCPDDGHVLLAAKPEGPLIGRILGNRDSFEIVARIGEGAMGEVFAGRRRSDGMAVALKVMRQTFRDSDEMVARFRREARASAAVDSPHVVKVYDYGDTDGWLFMVMELLVGGTVSERLKEMKPLPVADAVWIASRVARALDAAHRAGLVHRDLKPSNIMLLSDGGIRVLDFGIAGVMADSALESQVSVKLTQIGTLLGTPLYMSPEAACMKPVGPPGDLYSLGIVLFEMIVGRPPFVARNIPDLLVMHTRELPTTLRYANPDADPPDDLEALMKLLLAKSPSDRPDSADAVAEALESIAKRLGVTELAGEPTQYGLQVPVAKPADSFQKTSLRLGQVAGSQPPAVIHEPATSMAPTVATPVPAELRSVGSAGTPRTVVWTGDTGELAAAPDTTDDSADAERDGSRKLWIGIGAAGLILAVGITTAVFIAIGGDEPGPMTTRSLTTDPPVLAETVGAPSGSTEREATPPATGPTEREATPPAGPTEREATPPATGPTEREATPPTPPAPIQPTAPGEEEERVTPTPAPVTQIAVRANQPCAVSIDGTPVGQTPIAARAIAPGRHRVTCDPERGADLSAFVTVEEGRTVEHVFRVRRNTGNRRIDIQRDYH